MAAELLELAVTLKREQPRRAATQIARISTEQHGHSPHERTLQRHFRRVGLDRELAAERGGLRAFGRFQAEAPTSCGPPTHSTARPWPAARRTWLPPSTTTPAPWSATAGPTPKTPCGWSRAQGRVRRPRATRRPRCRQRLAVHLPPAGAGLGGARHPPAPLQARPAQGRGKIERVFRTVGEQFLVELEARGGAKDLEELNRLFGAWVEGVDHHHEHPETGQAPMERFGCGAPPRLPSPPSCGRRSCGPNTARSPSRRCQPVRQPLPGRPRLVGATLELVFDPFDLGRIQVRYQQRPMVRRSPSSSAATSTPPPPRPRRARHRQAERDRLPGHVEQRIAATQRRRIADASLPEQPTPDPGADAHDHAATADPSIGDTTQAAPAGVGSHPATTSRRTRKTSQQSAAPPPSPSPTSRPPTPTRTGRR